MKRIAALLLLLIHVSFLTYGQTSENESVDSWYSDKYSMFIHFGLYSHLGGVWDGEPVRQGYSEQIQSFAGIFSDWYASTAYEFVPDAFDADEIALLAKNAGMRSIVFTSKHHDGFCMYDTGTTDYNSMDMLPEGRDFVREISEACARHGLKFGLYYSLIDWNYPHAYPISSHNADFVTVQHHEFSKSQIRELLTSYGPVSELWFDMGSLEPWQSREMYELVKSLQPDCMVSGRLGNDVYDFAVMADNRLPQTALHAPWQSAASMFSETWSYRSWQERGNVADKVAEKLRSLISVVSKGGNYLLNIGPASDGSVVPFEREVLLSVGDWLKDHGDAIYGTSSSPFMRDFEWGDVTMKGKTLYLLLTGKCPEDGRAVLPVGGYRLMSSEGAEAGMKGNDCVVMLDASMYSDPCDVRVISLEFDQSLASLSSEASVSQKEPLTWENSQPEYSYSCFDYYSNYRSTVGYGWNVDVKKPVRSLKIMYTSEEEGREIVLDIDGMKLHVRLCATETTALADLCGLSSHSFDVMRGGVFDGPSSWEGYSSQQLPSSESSVEMNVSPFSNYLMRATAEVKADGFHVLEVTSGNGMELVVDGRTMAKHLNPYRTVKRKEKILLYLEEGRHELMFRAYNRFEPVLSCALETAPSQEVHVLNVDLPSVLTKGVRHIGISAGDNASEHTDCGLHNLVIRL